MQMNHENPQVGTKCKNNKTTNSHSPLSRPNDVKKYDYEKTLSQYDSTMFMKSSEASCSMYYIGQDKQKIWT